MEAVFVVLGFVVIVGVVLLTTRKADPLEPDPVDRRDAGHPANATGDDGEGVSSLGPHDFRFSVVIRGYRMDEVDAVIERLVNDVAERDTEIQRLTSGTPPRTSAAPTATGLPRRTVPTPQPEPEPEPAPHPESTPRASSEEPDYDVFGRPVRPEDGRTWDDSQSFDDGRT